MSVATTPTLSPRALHPAVLRATALAIAACLLSPTTSSGQLAQQVRGDDVNGQAERARPAAPSVDVVQTERATNGIRVDAQIDEVDWQSAPVFSDFTQRDPDEGAAPSERTEVRVLYDDDALYVTARMYDSAPDSIVARLGRRDADIDSDHFVVFLDPYRDLRTGYYFGINAAGTLYDGVLMNDDWDDDTWDGVWQGEARIDDEGWVAEFRIPYSQLRFNAGEDITWGINFRRNIARKNERDYVVYTPRSGSGFVSRFPELVGLSGIQPRRQVEAVPYYTTRAEFTDHADGDPFNDGSKIIPDVGVDLKVGLTSNLTLNGTVNPDFGQVEVDPAVVNLSDFETFFPEKRPFFIEGDNVFSGFGYGGANNNWGFNFGNPNFFYSRRVGRAPQGGLPANDYASVAEGARILGAAKITGRVGSGWNVGMIQSVTGRSMADIELDGGRSEVEVEPIAYYGVYRGQREMNDGRHSIGILSTITQRNFTDDRLRGAINQSAYAFGADGYTLLGADKKYALTAWGGLSRVAGTEGRMVSLQRSSLHYFQRPDAGHVSIDSTATSMSGSSGRIALNKQSGRVQLNSAVGYISPGFDINDLGFMFRTDIINAHLMMGYTWPDPGSWYRSRQSYLSVFNSMDFDGNTTWRGIWTMHWTQFLNYHELFWNAAYNPETVSNTRTRGGPLMLNQPGYQISVEYDTDSRKRLVWEIGGFTYRQKDSDELELYTEFVIQPASNIWLAVQPRLSFNNEFAQYVGTYDDPLATETFGKRYVFATLDQTTVSSSIRMNWTFTPELSLQLFAQPLISSGDYFDHKELRAPGTYDFMQYGEDGSTFDEDELIADPDGAGPAPALDLPNQDFNFRSLRGTAVARWEFRPGSLLYLVWTQSRSDAREFGDLRFGESLSDLLGVRGDNIFMVKFTYWLSR